MKDKEGNELEFKEFMKRWKLGIEGVTPLQQTKMQLWSTWIMILGLLCGIVISIIGIAKLWWLMIILIGGLGNTSIQLLGLWQKKRLLQKFDMDFIEAMKGGETII